jgi:HSP20 family molecular chaperone IbpA
VNRDDIHREVLRVFADACTPRAQRPLGVQGYCPPADVFYEARTDEVVARFELPGVELDDINLFVDRRQLEIKGERRFPVAEGRSYQQVELDYGGFERRIRLSVDIDPDNTSAAYEHGILEVRLALADSERGACRIPIRTMREADTRGAGDEGEREA